MGLSRATIKTVKDVDNGGVLFVHTGCKVNGNGSGQEGVSSGSYPWDGVKKQLRKTVKQRKFCASNEKMDGSACKKQENFYIIHFTLICQFHKYVLQT